MYEIGNECERINVENEWIVNWNKLAADDLAKLNAENDVNVQKKADKDDRLYSRIENQHVDCEAFDEEVITVKNHANDAFQFFGDSRIGKIIPIPKNMVQREFVALGAFNPVKILGWFEDL